MQGITIINAPFQSGNDRAGGGLAPEWLLRNGISAYADQPPVWVPMPSTSDNEVASRFGIKNYDNVVEMARTLRDVVAAHYGAGERVLTLGGDHTIALGTVAGVLQNEPNVGVIWFDAHGDVNTEATSPSKNAHGMPVAALLGLCKSGINDIATTYLKKQNIFWVGARDLDPGEKELLAEMGINDNVYTTEQIHQLGMKTVMADIQKKMVRLNVPALHLSFDIDGMDPSVVWATGTRVEDGLLQDDLDLFFKHLKDLPILKSIDFVEYNPALDDDVYSTGKWCLETLKQLIEK